MTSREILLVNKILTAFKEKNTSDIFAFIDELYDYVGYNKGEQILSIIDEMLYNSQEI